MAAGDPAISIVPANEAFCDDSVWAVTCLFTRPGFRKRGISRKEVLREELHVGTERTFADAGFTVVSRPTLRRVVMRIDF